MSLTKPSDYKGTVAISKNKYDKADLQLYLDELEPEYLKDLLGCDLYDAFVADLALAPVGQPTAQRFIDIYNAFCIDIDTICYTYDWYNTYYAYYSLNSQNRSRGIKEMLKGFMYLEYVRDQEKTNSSVGVSKSKGVASDLIGANKAGLKKAYNKSIKDYWNIQYFICQDLTTYPEYNGIRKQGLSII